MRINHVCFSRCSLFLLVLLGSLTACRKEAPFTGTQPAATDASAALFLGTAGDAAVPVSWYQLELKLIKETPGFSPPVAARAIAYTGISLHGATLGYRRGTPSLAGQLNGLQYVPLPERGKSYHWGIAANSTLAAIIRQLFPNASADNLRLITDLETLYRDSLSVGRPAAEISRSVSFGQQVADAVYQWSATDGGKDGYLHNFPADYIPPVGPGLWVPTPPAFQSAMLPYWGQNRLIVAGCNTDSGNIAPPAYATDTNSVFYQAAYVVYQHSQTPTPEKTLIAQYWADGGGTFTPPGHLLAITSQLITDQHLDLGTAAKLYAQVGIALNDAGIICWKYKYRYNLLRPITYIRARIAPGWNSLIGTPPFPSYTSGHASFSAAAGHILTANFGSHFAITDRQKVPDGFAPRSFSSFTALVNEAAISRVYGGIHYEFDSEIGKVTGTRTGREVLKIDF
ncbi:vanadium-dependent haloperoxidase [Chitinophaga nivalis]|uniref:Vanadium-dependent haloperoxidase n=1 Tax=Chitinophaga nivalis TaxID=2991709 RepID=A0ABT3IM76_9BACT|nr:vanadium-dependent haloperoxidase [Chitinophaga nivalis]MCW3465231.1 vanadium-dependent haloperoxidase [Chitinophaga nivalis]MCW3485077.1 vanadium-dependent haloperoxidase [Chitinophaga nivalis]